MTARRRRWLRWAAILLVAATAGPTLAHLLLLPLIARQRITAVLHQAGFADVSFDLTRASLWGVELNNVRLDASSIERARVEYAPQTLWLSRLKSLDITGAEIVIEPPTRSQTATTAPATAIAPPPSDAPALELPLDRIDIANSAVIVRSPAGDSRLPLDVHLGAHADRPYEIVATIAAGRKPLILNGSIDPRSRRVDGTIQSDGIAASLLASLATALAGLRRIDAEGALAVSGTFGYADGQATFAAEFEPTDLWFSQPQGANLGWHAGVLQVKGAFGSGLAGSVEIALEDMEFESESSDMEIEGLSGQIAIQSLAPIATRGAQRIEIARLRSGEMVFRNGFVNFVVQSPSSIQIASSRWNWMGGTISASDAQIDPQRSEFALTVEANGLQLKQLLEFFAEDRARGEGRVDARLPIVVQGWRIGFGDGRVESIGNGVIQIIDSETIAQTIGQTDDPAKASQRDEIAKALRDFEYDVLRAELVHEPDRGLMAHIDLKGRGRTGTRQPLHVEINIDGLDQALLYYLGIQKRFSEN